MAARILVAVLAALVSFAGAAQHPDPLEVRIVEFKDSQCRGAVTSTLVRQINTCAPSQDGRNGLV